MPTKDTHAEKLNQFIEYMLLASEETKPAKSYDKTQKHLLGLTDTETDYATSHIVVKARNPENITYIWAGWYPNIATSHLFLSSHPTDNNVPHHIRKPVSFTIPHEKIENENWWLVATSLVYGYFPSYESPPLTNENKLVTAVAFWLESIASELAKTEPSAIHKKPKY